MVGTDPVSRRNNARSRGAQMAHGISHNRLAAPNTKKPADLVPDPAAAREKLKLLWIGVGDKDNLMRISQGVHDYLKDKDVPHVYRVDGNAHDFTEWKNNLYLFSQRIFR